MHLLIFQANILKDTMNLTLFCANFNHGVFSSTLKPNPEKSLNPENPDSNPFNTYN
jgi:hypothetical protein